MVVLAKAALPGRVKTRLTRGPRGLTTGQTLRVYRAAVAATLARTAGHAGAGPGRRVLALDDPTATPPEARAYGWHVVNQGSGTLGERIARAWDHAVTHAGPGPVAVFGTDCPDVPATSLAAIGPALTRGDAAIGSVADGGYWTLAAHHRPDALLTGIDWGTARVYDQTRRAADAAGLRLIDLPAGHDLDHPADLADLRRRLDTPPPADDPALAELAAALASVPDRAGGGPAPPRPS